MNFNDFASEILSDAQFRGRRRLGRKLLRCIAACWPEKGEPGSGFAGQVAAEYRTRYGNPLVLIAFQILLTALINVVVEWWRNRRAERSRLFGQWRGE